MENVNAGSTGLARRISKASNPCLLSVITLLAMVWTYPAGLSNRVSWTTAIISLLTAAPLGYVYLRMLTTARYNRTKTGPISFLRQNPKDIVILGLICGIPSLILLEYIKAPPLLLETLIALLTGALIVALIYVFYRVSFHLTALTILVIMAIVAWGQGAFILLAGIPLVSWSRYRTQDHSLIQLVSGVALGVAIGLAVLFFQG